MRRIFCQVDEMEMEWLGIEYSEITLKNGAPPTKGRPNQLYWCRSCKKSLTVAPLENEIVES